MKSICFDFDNIGGISRLYAIPVSSFVRIRKDYVKNLNYLECRDLFSIIEIPVYTDNTFSFTENQTFDTPGDGYNIEISGIIPKMMPVNSSDIGLLERGEWYVLCEDRNGNVKFSGDENVRLKFTSRKESGAAFIDHNQISFTFSCLQENPSVDIIDNF
ncbi:hypothetical protein EZS27_000358 [termite gut metagenome]|uniref:Uncharacterized protein n=1 Tax=termite gut metagenome TaxID=433724 RepID=A0A5J4T2S2_9ZZZZ